MHSFHQSILNEGYVICPNVLAKESFTPIYQTIFAQFKRKIPSLERLEKHRQPWFSREFHDEIRALRKDNRAAFSCAYDCTYNSTNLHQFLVNPALLKVSAEVLNTKEHALSATGFMIRMDPPQDVRNSLKWHQDRPYYPETQDSDNGIVCWIPMQDVTPQNGGLNIIPGSHKEGVIKTNVSKMEGGSEQRQIPYDIIKNYSPIAISAKMGDVVFVSSLLIHQSGENSSENVRFTGGIRFHRMDDGYLPPSIQYIWNKSYQGDLISY